MIDFALRFIKLHELYTIHNIHPPPPTQIILYHFFACQRNFLTCHIRHAFHRFAIPVLCLFFNTNKVMQTLDIWIYTEPTQIFKQLLVNLSHHQIIALWICNSTSTNNNQTKIQYIWCISTQWWITSNLLHIFLNK